MQQILLKRGLENDLPELAVGEPAVCTDTGNFYIGATSGNKKINSDGSFDLRTLPTVTSVGDSDSFAGVVSNANKRFTISTLKTYLKSYFDTLYNKYVLPTATSTVIGGVAIGESMRVDSNGKIDVAKIDGGTF